MTPSLAHRWTTRACAAQYPNAPITPVPRLWRDGLMSHTMGSTGLQNGRMCARTQSHTLMCTKTPSAALSVLSQARTQRCALLFLHCDEHVSCVHVHLSTKPCTTRACGLVGLACFARLHHTYRPADAFRCCVESWPQMPAQVDAQQLGAAHAHTIKTVLASVL